jgi:hypothetical protein
MRTPDLYVKIKNGSYHRYLWCKASLQTKAGYLYLSWREGRKVKTIYLGKAKKSSPTTAAQ